jgi:ABC-2 type transport system permease protein
VTALVSSELLKLRTTRTAFGFLVAVVLLTLGIGAAGFATLDVASEQDVKDTLSGAGVVSALLLVLGSVAATGEYRHGTITSSLLVCPDRLRFLTSKLLAYLLTGAGLGLVAMVVTLAVGVPWLSARDQPVDLLGAGDYISLVVQGVALAALCGALGVAVGALVRNQVAAVVGLLVYLFVLDPVLSLVSDDVAAYSPGGAIGGLGGNSPDYAIDPLPAGLVLLGWTLLLAGAAVLAERRRDVF